MIGPGTDQLRPISWSGGDDDNDDGEMKLHKYVSNLHVFVHIIYTHFKLKRVHVRCIARGSDGACLCYSSNSS